MLIKISFENDEQIKEIINKNSDKYLIEIQYLKVGNFLIFSDVPTIEILQKEQGDRITDLETVNNTQEETIATISYELMMMQTTTNVELKVGGHSPKFNMIKGWYNKSFWTESMIIDAVNHKWLTQEEANEILGV